MSDRLRPASNRDRPRTGPDLLGEPLARLLATALALCLLAFDAAGLQLPRNRSLPEATGLDRGEVGPGQGPLEPFQTENWEYWWFLNGEVELDLRQRLARLEVPGAFTDYRGLLPADRDAVVESLQRACTNASGPIHPPVLMALAKCGGVGALEAIFSAWGDASLEVRRAAVLALAVLGDPSAAGALELRLADAQESAETRTLAALALGGIGELEPLRRGLEEKFFERLPTMVQIGLVHAVGWSGRAELAVDLDLLFERRLLEKAYVRGAALEAVGRLAGAGSRARLEEGLKHDATSVRRSSALAYGRLLAKSADESACRRLRRHIEDEPDSVVRNFLHLALGRIGGDAALPALGKALAPSARGTVRGGFVQPSVRLSQNTLGSFAALALGLTGDGRAAGALSQQLRRESRIDTKGAIAVGLGMLGPGRQSERGLVAELKKTGDPKLRAHLALACGMVGASDSSSITRRWLESEHDQRLLPAAAVSLALLGERARTVDLLLDRLGRERSESDRASLLYALALVGDRRAVEPGIAALEDASQSVAVRSYAAVLLGELADRRARRRLADLGSDLDYVAEPTLLQWLFTYL